MNKANNSIVRSGFGSRKTGETKSSRPFKKSRKNRRRKEFPYPYLLTNYNLPPLSYYGHLKGKHDKNKRGLIKIRQNIPFFSRWPMALSVIYDVPFKQVKGACMEVIGVLEHRVAYKGLIPTMVFFKEVQGGFRRFMANSRFDTLKTVNVVDKDGLPLEFIQCKTLSMNNGPNGWKYRQLVDSILQVYRLFLPKGDLPSQESITAPFDADISNLNGDQVSSFFRRACLTAGISEERTNFITNGLYDTVVEHFPIAATQKRINSVIRRMKFHISSKNGPNGPAVPSVPVDYHFMKSSGPFKELKSWIYLMKYKDLKRLLFYLRKPALITNHSNIPGSISKISEKIEVGGKVRLFAVIDYLTQCAMSGLHSYIFKWLKGLPEDSTHDHNKAAQLAKSLTVSGDRLHLYSVDLSTATDRLPLLLQASFIRIILGPEYSKLWSSLMVDRDFDYHDSKLRYAVGQPMGALSSWAMLALTHHMIVRTCFKLCGKSYHGKYSIIGDDVFLVGDDVFQIYKLIMSEILRVPISPTKGYDQSIVSGQNPMMEGDTSVIEIAKRVFYNGYEISGISPNILKESFAYPASFCQLLMIASNKLTYVGEDATVAVSQVLALSQLTFRPIESVQTVMLPSTPAHALLRGEVGVFGLEMIKYIPWVFDNSIAEKLKVNIYNQMAARLKDSLEKSLEKIISFTREVPSEYNSKRYTVVWSHYKTLFRLLSKQLSTGLYKAIDKLVQDPDLVQDAHELDEIFKILHGVIDLQSVVEGSEVDRRELKVRIMGTKQRLVRSLLKEELVQADYSSPPRVVVSKEAEYDGFVIQMIEIGEDLPLPVTSVEYE